MLRLLSESTAQEQKRQVITNWQIPGFSCHKNSPNSSEHEFADKNNPLRLLLFSSNSIIFTIRTIEYTLSRQLIHLKQYTMEKSIKGTRTEQNLLKAFAGESQAMNRYLFFAKQAKNEGLEQIAAIFEKTAWQEQQHAKRFFKFLEE